MTESRAKTHGGRRAGAGRKPGPAAATIERQDRIRELLREPYEQALLAGIRPVDILEAVARRLLADGDLHAAACFAARAAPYRHRRKT